jgi:hypothetical protein
LGTWKLGSSNLGAWEFKIKTHYNGLFRRLRKKFDNFGFSKAWKFCSKGPWLESYLRISWSSCWKIAWCHHWACAYTTFAPRAPILQIMFLIQIPPTKSSIPLNFRSNVLTLAPHLQAGNNFQTQVQIWKSYLDHRRTFWHQACKSEALVTRVELLSSL